MRRAALLDALLKAVRERTQLAVQRNDFKLEQLQPHLFMNFRIVDEHGRQLGMGRDLAALKAEFGVQARSAFQALAALKRATVPARVGAPSPQPSPARAQLRGSCTRAAAAPHPLSRWRERAAVRVRRPPLAPRRCYTAWTFGELPELMELRRGAARCWSASRR